MRGQPRSTTSNRISRRIIPARAGPTCAHWWRWAWRSDHPRSCGANAFNFAGEDAAYGSSPLVRGQLIYVILVCALVRIIPARAGPTHVQTFFLYAAEDHPRSCGANVNFGVWCLGGDGSSPLVRGQPSCDGSSSRRHRIIPARAGPTKRWLRPLPRRSDHPRSCGANSLILRGKSGLSQIKIFDYSSGIWQ